MIGSMNATSPLSQEVWERTPAEAQAYIRALAARVAALEATVQRLLERLRMDSQHASQRPSSDAPTTRRPRQRRTPSGRKPGGQPGHQGQVVVGLAQMHEGLTAQLAGETKVAWPVYLALLAEVYGQVGQVDEGQRLLAEVYGWFTEGFDTVDLQEAHALLKAWVL